MYTYCKIWHSRVNLWPGPSNCGRMLGACWWGRAHDRCSVSKARSSAVPVQHCRPEDSWKVAALQSVLGGWRSWSLILAKDGSHSKGSSIWDRHQQGWKVDSQDCFFFFLHLSVSGSPIIRCCPLWETCLFSSANTWKYSHDPLPPWGISLNWFHIQFSWQSRLSITWWKCSNLPL